MKKILAFLLAAAMLLSMAACGNKKNEDTTGTTDSTATTEDTTTQDTVGGALLEDFKANATGSAQEIAEHLLTNKAIAFMGAVAPVEEGLLTGFGETEITGFEEGAMFAPMGYIFALSDGADVESFKTMLKDNANLRWNICTAAEELIVANEGNTVFFLMSPRSFEQPETENTDTVGQDAIVVE